MPSLLERIANDLINDISGKTDSDRRMKAVAQVETGGEKDPFIRTRVAPEKGSTAYGPLQVTRTLAEKYRKDRKHLFNKEELIYLNRFIKQGQDFAKYGKEPDKKGYHPRYEYGGAGDLTSKKDRAMYWQVMGKVFQDTVGDKDAAGAAKAWHGGDNEKLILDYERKLKEVGYR